MSPCFSVLLDWKESTNQEQWCHAGMKECSDSLPGPLLYRLLLLITCLACLGLTMDSSSCYL